MDADPKSPQQEGRSSAFHAAACSGSSDLTENAAKQNLQNNSPLQDKGLLRVIFANEAKTRQKPIYQKTDLIQ